MQLSEILEENSIRSISKKTNISEQNLERLLASNFANLKKVKTLGFISIIEREYSTDLTAMKEEALGYYADADAILAKGVIALLLRVYSNQTPEDILNAEVDFIDKIGLKENLSPTRANGLEAMVKQIKLYALAFRGK